MGYPLAGTPVASLIEYILALQKNVRYIDRNPLFYFRDVLPVLNHRYILSTSPEIISSLVKEITENNKIYISHTELGKTPLLEILFTPVTGVEAFSDYLIKVLEELNKVMSALSDEEGGGRTPADERFGARVHLPLFHHGKPHERGNERRSYRDENRYLLPPIEAGD